MTPDFTILIAAYNAEAFLPRCLDSLLRQTEGAFEALCVDDCSTDGTAALLREYAARDGRIRVLRTKVNSGQAVARNLALRQASAPWTLMLDADDWLAPDALALVKAAAAKHPRADSVLLQVVKVQPDGREETLALPPDVPADGALTGYEAALLAIDWRIPGLYAVRTELHQHLPFDDTTRLYSDDNAARLHFFYSREVCTSTARYYYRQHADSTTHQPGISRLDFLRANASLRRLVRDHRMGREAERICEEHCWRNFCGLWREMHRARRAFTPSERREVRSTFADALAETRPELLPSALLFRPSTLYLRPLFLFAAWQRCYAALRKIFRKPPLH